MILIADGGSTKTNWILVAQDGARISVDTEGYNPYFVDPDYIARSLKNAFEHLHVAGEVLIVHYYGSGCFPESASIVRKGIAAVFFNAEVFVELDLLAAARALLGIKPGFAAILGTGTNTCLYDGSTITQNIDSLGFILGDEGSGTSLGKKLLASFIRNELPDEISQSFHQEFSFNKEQIFQRIYSSPFPNRFCAGFAPFIHKHLKTDYISKMVQSCFRELFENLVSKYKRYYSYSFNCIGSIAYHFSEPLRKVALEFGMQPGVIIPSAIESLTDFHQHHEK